MHMTRQGMRDPAAVRRTLRPFRSRVAGGPVSPLRPGRRAEGSERTCRHRRSSEGAGSVFVAPSSRGPSRKARTLSRARKRVPRPSPTNGGDISRSYHLPRIGRFLAGGSGYRTSGPALDSGRITPILPCPYVRGKYRMEAGIHKNLPGAGPAPTRYQHPCDDSAPILDHARTLARTDLELLGVRPVVWSCRHDGKKIPGYAVCGDGDPPSHAMARESRQAPGEVPKVYIRDTGLLHTLLGQRTQPDLEGHPKAGASREGFALEQVLRRTGALPEECHFWATHAGAELDLLIVRGRKRLGFEFKRTAAPSVTKSMKTALADLRMDRLDVVHAGEGVFPLGERLRAVALKRLPEDVERLT